MNALQCQKLQAPAALKTAPKARASVRAPVVVRAQSQEVDRRAALGLLAGAAALVAGAQPSEAAYGEAANVFGRATNTTGFSAYKGNGVAMLLPSKWGPSKERDFPNTVTRFQDSFDDVNNIVLIVEPVSAGSIEALGSPDKFLQDKAYLLGKSAFTGETKSEGGFAPGKVAATSVLEVAEAADKKGTKYYKYHVLARTADNDEGGRHQLIAAGVKDNKLYLLKVQVGDKRWNRGEKKNAETAWNSFTIA